MPDDLASGSIQCIKIGVTTTNEDVQLSIDRNYRRRTRDTNLRRVAGGIGGSTDGSSPDAGIRADVRRVSISIP